MSGLRALLKLFVPTPLHPQWLLGPRKPPAGLRDLTGTVLDIGAADRWIAAHLSPVTSYVAFDYPATGRERYHAQPDIFADAVRLPFADAVFDGVVCLEVLEHVPAPAKVMPEISRVLRTRGRAWLSMPFPYPVHDAPFDFQRYTEYGLRRDAQNAGLEVVVIQKSGHAIRTAGLLMCLAIAGGVHARRGLLGLLLISVTAVAVVLVNLFAWLLSVLWPDWTPMAVGHAVEVSKP